MKFIHSADIHLGRQFSGLSRSSPALGKLFLEAGYSAWKRIVERALDLRVDFVTLGGDIFDASNPSLRPRVAFRDGLERLNEAGIPVYAVLGNHDPFRTFPDSLRSLPGFFLFGPEPDAREITQGAVIQGVSFENSAVTANLARTIRRLSGTELAIGLLHTNVSGNNDHGNYAPCTLDDLRAAAMDVWCLGHVHSPAVLLNDPLIVYSGSAQGARPNETGQRGCYLISVEERGKTTWEFLSTAPVKWDDVDLNLTDCSCPEDILDSAELICSDLTSKFPDSDAVVARISLHGRPSSPAMSGLAKDEEFRSLLSERLEGLGMPVFVADLIDGISSESQDELSTDSEGFLADFLSIAERSVDDAGLRGALADQIHRELAKVGRKHYEAIFDVEGWKQNPELARECVNRATELVLSLFRESRQ